MCISLNKLLRSIYDIVYRVEITTEEVNYSQYLLLQ